MGYVLHMDDILRRAEAHIGIINFFQMRCEPLL